MKYILNYARGIGKEQCKDTGMAMVLLLLIISFSLKQPQILLWGIAALVINMTWARFYFPIAIIWLGASNLVGAIMSRVLLTIIFFAVVTPIGWIRKMLGNDSMQLKSFKTSDKSVMIERNYTYTGRDIQKPY
jgi:hypothetical protein